ncbi:MAG: hypothetical protein ABIU96_10615 [Rhodanobacter sp.]
MDKRRGIDRSIASKHELEKAMRNLRQSLVVIAAVAGMATVAAAVTIDPPATEDFDSAFKQYNETLIETLVAEGTPHSMTLAATAITYGRQGDESSVDRQRALSARAAAMAPDDAWVQWIAAMNLPRSEVVSEPALALQRIEPDNGAAWLFQLAAASEAKDEAAITEALARIGASRHFDEHFGDAMVEWLKVVRADPMPQLATEGSKEASEQMQMIMAIGRAAAISLTDYTSPMRACKPTEQSLAADRRETCIATGRLMLKESKTVMSMQTGAALLRLAGAEEAVEATRNADYLMKKAIDLSRFAMLIPAELARYQADWLQTGSEVQAMKNQLTQAGIPLLPPKDWNEDPYGNLAKMSEQNNG